MKGFYPKGFTTKFKLSSNSSQIINRTPTLSKGGPFCLQGILQGILEVAMFQRFLSGYKFLLDKLAWLETISCMILFLAGVAIYALEIFTRYLLNYSWAFGIEFATLSIVWMYFLGYTVIFYRGEDIVLEYFFNLFPKRFKQLVDWLTQLAILLFFIILLKGCFLLRAFTKSVHHPVLSMTRATSDLPFLVATFLVFLVSIYFVLVKTEGLIRELMGKNIDKSN